MKDLRTKITRKMSKCKKNRLRESTTYHERHQLLLKPKKKAMKTTSKFKGLNFLGIQTWDWEKEPTFEKRRRSRRCWETQGAFSGWLRLYCADYAAAAATSCPPFDWVGPPFKFRFKRFPVVVLMSLCLLLQSLLSLLFFVSSTRL